MSTHDTAFVTPSNAVSLRPLDSPELIRLAADWLAQKDNYQWLDFGDGRQLVSPEWLKIGMQRGSYVIRLFTSPADGSPIGVVGLGDINVHFKTANLWAVLGDKSQARLGLASQAVSRMLTLGFKELGLRAIHTWIVEHNHSIHVAEKVKFKYIGRQRQCHVIDGRAYDRLWFDLLASEHEEG